MHPCTQTPSQLDSAQAATPSPVTPGHSAHVRARLPLLAHSRARPLAQVATLSFVTPEHFGLLAAACEGACWEAALAALRRMGSVKAPLDKVACVVETVAQLGTITDPCDASFVGRPPPTHPPARRVRAFRPITSSSPLFTPPLHLSSPLLTPQVRLFALAVLRARPAQLYSQLEYIARFVHQASA